jgi:hypothetical protein
MTDNSISQRLGATQLYCCKGINSNRQAYWLQNKVWGKGDRGLEIRSAIILSFFSVLFLSMVQQKFVGAECIHEICWPLRTRRRIPSSAKIRRVEWYISKSVLEQPNVFIFRVVENLSWNYTILDVVFFYRVHIRSTFDYWYSIFPLSTFEIHTAVLTKNSCLLRYDAGFTNKGAYLKCLDKFQQQFSTSKNPFANFSPHVRLTSFP